MSWTRLLGNRRQPHTYQQFLDRSVGAAVITIRVIHEPLTQPQSGPAENPYAAGLRFEAGDLTYRQIYSSPNHRGHASQTAEMIDTRLLLTAEWLSRQLPRSGAEVRIIDTNGAMIGSGEILARVASVRAHRPTALLQAYTPPPNHVPAPEGQGTTGANLARQLQRAERSLGLSA